MSELYKKCTICKEIKHLNTINFKINENNLEDGYTSKCLRCLNYNNNYKVCIKNSRGRYCVYKINIDGYIYIGYTSKSFNERLDKHIEGNNTTLSWFLEKNNIDKDKLNTGCVELEYYINFMEARIRESQLQYYYYKKNPKMLLNVRIEYLDINNIKSIVYKYKYKNEKPFDITQDKYFREYKRDIYEAKKLLKKTYNNDKYDYINRVLIYLEIRLKRYKINKLLED